MDADSSMPPESCIRKVPLSLRPTIERKKGLDARLSRSEHVRSSLRTCSNTKLVSHGSQGGMSLLGLLFLKRRRQDLFDGVHEDKTHVAAYVLRNLLEIFLVGLRQNHPPNARSSRRQDLFLNSPDWQHEPAQTDLPRHGRIAPHRYVEIRGG